MPVTAPDRVPYTPLSSLERLPRNLARSGEGAISPLGLDRSVRRHLKSLTGETFVSFTSVRDAVSIWAADDRGMHFFQAGLPLSEIQALSGEFLALLEKPGSNPKRIQWLSRCLCHVLLGPILPLLEPSRSLAVHFSEELRCIPVGALESEEGGLLLERFPIWNAADFPWRVTVPTVEAISGEARLLIVDTLSAQPGAAEAASPQDGHPRLASRVFPNHDLVCGASVTREQFSQLALQAEVLHCRTQLTEAVRCPCLHFAIDGSEPVTLPLPGYNPHTFPHCTLGVLDVEYDGGGAAETREIWRRASNLLHYVGVTNVVIPRWNVPAETRRAFHEAFYEELKNGVSLREAMRNAPLKLRSDPQWRHPHHWAGFTLSVSHL